MNTKPAEESLALWMEGELDGAELARVDAWAAHHPELLAQRAALGEFKSQLCAAIPAAVEPPYPDFFNARIERHLREVQGATPAAVAKPRRGWWAAVLVPGMAAAMALCFWLGIQVADRGPASIAATDATAPVLYTPFQGVTAAVVDDFGMGGTVIVLEGLTAMPDSLEVPESAGLPEQSLVIPISTQLEIH